LSVLVGLVGDVDCRLPTGTDTRPVRRPADLDRAMTYLLVRLGGDADALDGLRGVLDKALDLRIPTSFIVDRIEPWMFTDLVLAYQNVEEIFDPAIVATVADRVERRSTRILQKGEGVPIGRLRVFPSDPDRYEAHRYLSLFSASTAQFVRELRAALSQMEVPRPPLPWDPHEDQEPVGEKGPPAGVVPNLSSVVTYAKEPWAWKMLVGDKPRKDWTRLPPPLLLLGESGTGKSLLAEFIHEVLNRGTAKPGAFVPISVAAMEVHNFDYELFGAAGGTFSEVAYRVGALTEAAYGTAFFDEIGDMPQAAQTRLLTFFNNLLSKMQGGPKFFTYAHVIAATNRDVNHNVGLGTFRHDLLARFRNRLTLPTLRSRREDEREMLIDFVAQDPLENPRLDDAGRESDDGDLLVSHISHDAYELLKNHDYAEGNFRELEAVVHRALEQARRASDKTLRVAHLKDTLRPNRFRPDADRRVIQVRELPAAPEGATIEVDSDQELGRLAELLERPIFRLGSTLVVIDRDTRYTAETK
jgi:MoxR-like ATPase